MFSQIFQRACYERVPFVAIVSAIIEGRIPIRNRGQDGKYFRSLLLDREEASRHLQDEANRIHPTVSSGVAARSLRMNSMAFLHLAENGFLQRVPTLNGHRSKRLTHDEAARFASAYIYGAELRAWVATSTLLGSYRGAPRTAGSIISRLAEIGIRPVSGPGIDGGRLFVFRRADLEIDSGEMSRRRG